jgi:short-subunit dehydrogenase
MNILVTGASKGIGFEIVKQFSMESTNNIVAISRDIELLQELKSTCKNEYNNDIHIYSIDFLSTSYKEDLNKILLENNVHFDIIINNAGLLINKLFSEINSKEIQDIYQVNTFAPMFLIQSIIPYLNDKTTCHIVNIGSMGGYQGSVKFPGLSIYSSSKAALASLTECLAEEYKDRNIKFNCLALGSVQTEMLDNAFPGFKAQVSTSQMAKYIKEFSLEGAKYFNGKHIPVSNSTP